MSREVLVVSFRPFQERASVGGFEWFNPGYETHAHKFFDSEISRSDADNYIYRMVSVNVNGETINEITNELDERIEDLEYNLPTIRERIPQ